MPSVNPGPATTSTQSQTAALAQANTPNYGNLGNGQWALRMIAGQRAVPINGLGDAAFLPIVNAPLLTLNVPGIVLLTNPYQLVSGVPTPATAVVLVFRLWTGPNGTGTALTGAAPTITMTGATAALSTQSIPWAIAGYYNTGNWGVGATSGQGGAASNGIYVNVTTASTTATFMDIFCYGMDNT
jgi:hypothetical protein